MNDHYKTLDETIAAIRSECDTQLKAMSDKLLAAEIEATMARDQLKQAREAQTAAERITTKLLTQFGLVSQVFEEARNLALSLRGTEATEVKTVPPANSFAETNKAAGREPDFYPSGEAHPLGA